MLDAGALSIIIDEDDGTVTVDPATGTTSTRQPNGDVVVDIDPKKQGGDEKEDEFYRNLVNEIDAQQLSRIGVELLEAIEADDESRSGYLETHARGYDLLGIELKEPKATVGEGAQSGEGMSSVTNPLLVDAICKSWANAVGEFLPANGPLKIEEDGEETPVQDDLAETLEEDMNYVFKTGMPEYYPDTSHMLLWGVFFGGSGIKKVYRCPIKRRPTIESVDIKDFIVSDTTKDLKACGRITHRIMMRPSVMKRMQFIGAYRDVTLTQPQPTTNALDDKQDKIQGTTRPKRPEDQPYEVYETQCELDLPEFAKDTQFEGEGLALPYLVTLEKDSQQILAIRRDWHEDDEECQRRRMYVKWPYIPGPGFFGTGLLNLLGNASAAMTAAWREALDAGMFASFPGGLMAKDVTRQNSSVFRVAPGEFKQIETGGKPINQVVMGMPYKDPSAGLMNMMDRIQAQAEKLGGAVDIPTQQGIQNVPVGTMLAHIEQATKVMLATHQGMHTAQSEEFELVFDLFREHPEDFWRCLKKEAKAYWNEQKFLQALDDVALVPRSDPNTPSHIHRVAQALGLVELSTHPVLGVRLDPEAILRRVLQAMRISPQGLVVDPPPQPPMQDLKGQAAIMDAQTKKDKLGLDAAQLQQRSALEAQKAADEKQVEGIRLAREEIIHRGDLAKQHQETQMDMAKAGADMQMQREAHQQDLHLEHAKHGLAVQAQEHSQGLAEQGQQHKQGLAEDAQKHAQSVAEYQAMNPPEKKEKD